MGGPKFFNILSRSRCGVLLQLSQFVSPLIDDFFHTRPATVMHFDTCELSVVLLHKAAVARNEVLKFSYSAIHGRVHSLKRFDSNTLGHGYAAAVSLQLCGRCPTGAGSSSVVAVLL